MRPSKVDNPSGYDDLYRLIRGQATSLVVDSNRDYAQVLLEVTNGATNAAYTYGDDLISQTRNSATSFYHYDGLGSTRALTDGSGAITDSYNYEAFGQLLNQTGTTENSYLFTGEQYDSGLDQYYLRARYYDPSQGRFTQQDTWMGNNSDPVTLHKYLYANADPGNMVDPSGRFSMGGLSASFSITGTLSTIATSSFSRFIGRAIVQSLVVAKTVSISLKQEIKKCRVTRGKKCRLPNIVVNGSDYPESQQHISDAQKGRGSNGIPITAKVTYKRGGSGGNRRWYANKPECKGITGIKAGKDCDEYPFFTTKEGGLKRYTRKQVSLRPIASCCNRGFGRRIWGGAVRKAKTGDKFIVAPYGPISFYFVNGKFGM